jgi:protein ImuB
MLWLCLRFPLLPLEVFSRAESAPPCPAPAVAISAVQTIVCLDANAHAQGIRPGMSTSTAQALCAGLRLRERDTALEQAALQALADWAWGFTPKLCIAGSDRLLLELEASLRLFGGLPRLLDRIQSELSERRFSAQLGLAPTPLAAELFARALPCSAENLPAWCMAGDHSGFLDALGQLPVGMLEAPARQRQSMERLGLRRVGELLALPRAALGRRFGKPFLDYLMRLCGEMPDLRMQWRPREHFESQLQFLEPLQDREMLLFPMRRLLAELGQFLERRQLHARCIVWQLQPVRKEAQELPVSCSLEQHRPKALFELTRLALERAPIEAPLEALGLLCREFAALPGRSDGLFGDEAGSPDSERLLIDRLRTRLGAEGLYGMQIADAILPEESWQAVREPAPAAEETRLSPWMQRPCWMLQRPAPLKETAGAPCWHGALELLAGPERIDTAWWAEPQRRDYYIARHAAGTLLWVFRERLSGRWFLQGFFG